jgi:hypothetical protein
MEIRHSKVGYDKSLHLIAKRLRDDSENLTREALPTRWLDLILYLNEQERRISEGSKPKPGEHEGLAEAQRAVTNQEIVLDELLRTEEPTEDATALLEELREKAARALGERH